MVKKEAVAIAKTVDTQKFDKMRGNQQMSENSRNFQHTGNSEEFPRVSSTLEDKKSSLVSGNIREADVVNKDSCNDKHCPIHHGQKVRGRTFEAKVIGASMDKTAKVEWDFLTYVPKYERYSKSRTRLKVHNPACLNVKVGDIVQIGETKKISKTKSFVIMKILRHEREVAKLVSLEEELARERKSAKEEEELEKKEKEAKK